MVKNLAFDTFLTKKEAGKVEEQIYYGQTLNDCNMLFEGGGMTGSSINAEN